MKICIPLFVSSVEPVYTQSRNDPLINTAYAFNVYAPAPGNELLDDSGHDKLDELFLYLLDAVHNVSFKNTKHPIDCEQELKLQSASQ